MRKGLVVLICFSLLGFMSSCGGSGGGEGPDEGNDNSSPVAQIITPTEGSTSTIGDDVQFAGSVNDSEDGALTGTSLVWSSDVDGQVGTGETCASNTLSAGAHQISLTGTDSDGAEGIDTVMVTVNAAPATGILPDTGQTNSYTDTFGEDSDYTINPPAYTKLDAFGNDLDAGATDWAMVRDDVTSLIWEVKTDDGGIHDKDDTYTGQDGPNVFIAQLNSDNFGGYSDWRLPTIKELSTIVHKDTFSPAINTAYFPNTMPFSYWSSTFSIHGTIGATGLWEVYFWGGDIGSTSYSNNFFVRAVRGEQTSTNIVDNGNGTVTDTGTGLMWQQTSAGTMTWEAALSYCETLELGNHDDWRLPNVNELQSIVDYEAYNPSINSKLHTTSGTGFGYWSSTTYVYSTDHAWYVSFVYGHLGMSDNDKSQSYNVRAVRTVSGGGGVGDSE